MAKRTINVTVSMDKRILEGVDSLIEQEIAWREENPNPAKEFHRGFIDGLAQARYLVDELSRRLGNEKQSSLTCSNCGQGVDLRNSPDALEDDLGRIFCDSTCRKIYIEWLDGQ